MADLELDESVDDERFLVVSFNNEKPMTASQMASILRAMDQDYLAINGRHLVVSRLELGSTWVHFTEYAILAGSILHQTAAVVESIQALETFARRIITVLRSESELVTFNDLDMPDTSVDRTALAIAKAAIDTNSTVYIQKTVKTVMNVGTRTDSLNVKINPAQAKRARTYIRNRPKMQIEQIPRLQSGQDYKSLAGVMRALPAATGDLEELVQAIVQAHAMYGSTTILKSVADTLEGEGRSDIAIIIRRHIGKEPGTLRITE